MFDVPVFDFSNTIPESLIGKIRSRTIDGVVIRGFLSQAEVSLVRDYALKNSDDFIELKPGMLTWPLPLGVGAPKNQQSQHKWNSDKVGLKDRIFQSFKELGYKAIVPNLKDDQPISYGSFRYLNVAKKDILDLHVGNTFFNRFADFYSKFDKRVVVFNQLSYFVPLIMPESGGQLELFDVSWSSCKSLIKSEYFDLGGKRLVHYSEINSQSIDLKEGDLLLFAGGEIYHRVTPISEGNRLTFGGFIGFDTQEANRVYLWA